VRIERGARLIVGEIGEASLGVFSFVEQAARGIAGELRRQTGYRLASALPHPRCTLRRLLLKVGKSSAQASGIELIDGESADAALRATGAAGQPMSASAGHVGERGVDDLDQLLITRDSNVLRHLLRIAHPAIADPATSYLKRLA
jgi:hypothetical protein